MKFEVTEDQMLKVREWAKKQDEVVVKRQVDDRDAFVAELARDGIAYYGAIGGELSFIFTPNSIGISVVVKHAGTKEKLDLTDYDSW